MPPAARNIAVVEYGITLQYPSLPCVNVSVARSIWIPPEIAFVIKGQPFTGKLPDEVTGRMILFACKPPAENADTITNTGLRSLGHKVTDNKELVQTPHAFHWQITDPCCLGRFWNKSIYRDGNGPCSDFECPGYRVLNWRYEDDERFVESEGDKI